MGRRSNFKRNERDYYPTPYEAVIPLLPYLAAGTRFCEPCAGNGALIDHLERHGHICATAWDIEPQRADIRKADAFGRMVLGDVGCFITNPPWDRKVLHPLIEHLSMQRPTWLLFDAPWMHTKQAVPYLRYCSKIVTVGRVSWMENGTSGKEDCAWYCFDQRFSGITKFYGKQGEAK